MKTNYLINKHFYIKNDLQSLLIYYDFFSQGLSLPNFLRNPFILKSVHIVLRYLIIFMYVSKVYSLIYKTINLSDDALIIIDGRGSWGSKVKLIKKNGNLVIIKKVKDKKLFLKEMDFYNHYKNSDTRIKLPKCSFLKENIVEMEFIKAKSFQRLINEGIFSFKKSISFYNIICSELKKMYKKETTLIHGDLTPINILVDKNTYYLIDFTDSHINSYNYDFYSFWYYILCSYYNLKPYGKSIIQASFRNVSIEKLLKISIKSISNIEKQFIAYREARFPGFYN